MANKRSIFSKERSINQHAVEKLIDSFREGPQESRNRRWVILTHDFSGLGFAKMIKDAGEEVIMVYKNDDLEKPEEEESFKKVGAGIVPKFSWDNFNLAEYNDAYWVVDQNYNYEIADNLRSKGFRVFAGTKLMNDMEHDREFAVQIANKSGLQSPPTYPFKTIEEGLKFLDQNEDTAFVFKPDDSEQAYTTFVPLNEDSIKANRKVYRHMQSLKESGSYILQEKKKGIEANFELWFYRGEPFFAFCGLESKRKLNGDLGENVGCAHDILFKVPLESKGIRETIGRLVPFYRQQKYTGFADVNVIVADNKNWFLEVCNRFGYNSHPNLFMNLALDSFPNIMADFIDGRIEGMNKRFRDGFGASITLYHDHPQVGQPIDIPENIEKNFYCFDYYKEGKEYYLSAYYDIYVGIITGHGYTVQDAGHEALERSYKIDFPDVALRSDIDKHDLPNSVIKRYQALQSMGYVK